MRKLVLFAVSICASTGLAQTPASSSHVVARLADSTFWPEGIDADTASRRIYVASVRHGTIAELSPDGSMRELLKRDRADVGPIFGVRFDARRGVLWATTSGTGEVSGSSATTPALLQIRLSDGEIIKRWPVPFAPGGQVLGDLAIAPNGDVYFSDSVQPVLYILRAGATKLVELRSPLFRSLQGIAPAPDGSSVYLADYSFGLLRFSTATQEITRLDISPSLSTRGCDGIIWFRGAIIAVQNGASPARIVKFTLDPNGRAVTDAAIIDQNPLADEPTIGTIIGNEFIYVANSQWEKFDRSGARVPSRALTPPILLGVPIS